MEMSIITMGTASASANPHRHTSAHVVTVHNHRFLVDCGEGCQMSLQQCHVPFSWIDNILLSHLHGDHILGIFGLLSTMAMQGRTAPLYIYAPAGFQRILDFFYEQFADGVKYEIHFTPLEMKDKQQIIEMRPLRVYAFPLNHRVPTFGFLFEEKEPRRNVRKDLIEADNLLSLRLPHSRGERMSVAAAKSSRLRTIHTFRTRRESWPTAAIPPRSRR